MWIIGAVGVLLLDRKKWPAACMDWRVRLQISRSMPISTYAVWDKKGQPNLCMDSFDRSHNAGDRGEGGKSGGYLTTHCHSWLTLRGIRLGKNLHTPRHEWVERLQHCYGCPARSCGKDTEAPRSAGHDLSRLNCFERCGVQPIRDGTGLWVKQAFLRGNRCNSMLNG